jgi:hypothetical protein
VVECREAVSGNTIGCGAVALSTLTFISVPEPATLALLGVAFGWMRFPRRRKRN